MNDILAFFKSKVGKDSTGSISPLMQWMNPTLISAEEGKLEYQHVVRPEMTNPMHILHGGISAAMIDDAIGATVYSLNNSHMYTTVNLTIDYFAPAKVGDVLIAESKIIKKGNQIMNASCILWNHDKSRMIAKGQSNLIKTNIALK
jgi:uncharacterized protein (TIGR00369 family)